MLGERERQKTRRFSAELQQSAFSPFSSLLMSADPIERVPSSNFHEHLSNLNRAFHRHTYTNFMQFEQQTADRQISSHHACTYTVYNKRPRLLITQFAFGMH